jgi:hypothetical protein
MERNHGGGRLRWKVALLANGRSVDGVRFLVLICVGEWLYGPVFTIVEYDGSTACFVRGRESGICAIAKR